MIMKQETKELIGVGVAGVVLVVLLTLLGITLGCYW